jgi:hypothetical protein
MGKVAPGVAIGIRQRHPELHAVQNVVRLDRHFGVANTPARRHQIQLAGTDRGMDAGAVAMLHSPTEQPTHGLQSGVWMRRDVHARGHGAVVVDEAPRTNQRALSLRKRALHPERPRPAQRNLSRMQHLDPCGH